MFADKASGAIINKISPPTLPYHYKSKSHTYIQHLLTPAASNKYNLYGIDFKDLIL